MGVRVPVTWEDGERSPRAVRHRPIVVPVAAPALPPIDGRYDLAGWYLMGKIFRLRRTLPRDPPRLVDLGMGRGRDILYFARRGFRVLGIDWSRAAVDRAVRRADRLGVQIETRTQDLRTYPVRGPFDVVYSSCFLNCLPARSRAQRIAEFQDATSPGGIHAVNAFVRHARRAGADESDAHTAPFRRGELRGYYRGWTILETGTLRFRCLSSGPAHTHEVELLVARKPAGYRSLKKEVGRESGARRAKISHTPYKTKRPRAATKGV